MPHSLSFYQQYSIVDSSPISCSSSILSQLLFGTLEVYTEYYYREMIYYLLLYLYIHSPDSEATRFTQSSQTTYSETRRPPP